MVSMTTNTFLPLPGQNYRILAGQVFDPHTRSLVANQVITVDKGSGIILNVGSIDKTAEMDANSEVIDLRHLTILPGFVDTHVHFFLYPYAETPWQDQLTKESLAERTIRATVHARNTLLAGFTTVRDLGTEGAFDADLGLRKCLAGPNPIIPGPRYYCSNRAIVSTGAYGPKSSVYPSNDGIEGITGAEAADGRDACVRAVRKQIGAGTDWIKIYADYRFRSRLADVSPEISSRSMSLFNRDELEAMITTAHDLGVKVASHASTPRAIKTLLELNVDSIEHGSEMYADDGDVELIKKFAGAKGKTIWVPTLAAYYTLSQAGPGAKTWEHAKRTFQKAVVEEGMDNIACGGDTGVFAHGKNGLELVLMRKLGAEWNQVLTWATLGGWGCVRGPEWEGEEGQQRLRNIEEGNFGMQSSIQLERGVPFGAIRKGWAGDIVAIDGKLNGSAGEFEKAIMEGVRFVMKGGKVYKHEGKPVIENLL